MGVLTPVPDLKKTEEGLERLNASMEKLNKTTSKYSKILIWLTGVLGVLALSQTILFIGSL